MQCSKKYFDLKPFFRLNGLETRVCTIPVELISYAFQNRLIPTTHIFLAGKFLTNGRLPNTPAAIDLLGQYCGVKDRRTIKSHLQKLQEIGFVGCHKEIFYFRSFKHLADRINIKSVTAAKFNAQDFQSKSRFKAWAAAAIILYSANHQKRKIALSAKPRRSTSQSNGMTGSGYIFTTNRHISKILNCDLKEAVQIKKLTQRWNYIKYEAKQEKTNFRVKEVDMIRKFCPEVGKKLIVKDKTVLLTLPTEVTKFDGVKFKVKYSLRAPT